MGPELPDWPWAAMATGVVAVAVAWQVAGLLAAAWRFGRQWWLLRHLPAPRFASLFGALQVFADARSHEAFLQLAHAHGTVFRLRVFWMHIVCIADPWIVAEVLQRNHDFDKQWKLLSFLNELVSETGEQNMVTAPTKDRLWKAVRRAVSPSFSSSRIRAGFPGIVKVGSHLVGRLEELGPQAVVDVDEALSRESLDVIGEYAFDRDMGAIAAMGSSGGISDVLLDTTNAMLETSARVKSIMRRRSFWSKEMREGGAAISRFQATMRGLLAAMRKTAPRPETLAGQLLTVVDPATGKVLSDARILSEIGMLFIAGYDTSGHTAAWALYLVSQHPRVEAKVVEELARHGLLATPQKPQPRLPLYEDLAKLSYLRCVIEETLRMKPAAGQATTRICFERDIYLESADLLVPAGVSLRMPCHTLQNADFNWDEPRSFLPERWLEKDAEYAVDTGGNNKEGSTAAAARSEAIGGRALRHMPFLTGVRNCVGFPLARANLTSTLSQLWGRFSFRLAEEMGGPEGVEAAERTAITMMCAKGMKMHCMPRVVSMT